LTRRWREVDSNFRFRARLHYDRGRVSRFTWAVELSGGVAQIGTGGQRRKPGFRTGKRSRGLTRACPPHPWEAMFSDSVRLCRLAARPPTPVEKPGAAAVFLPATSSAFSAEPNGAIRPPGRHSACPGSLNAVIPDRLSRPTIMLSGFAPGSRIVRHFGADG